jgi:serine/threonine protein kinase
MDLQTDPRLLQDPLLAAAEVVNDQNVGRKVLGRCVLLRKLGQGGYGAVYLGWSLKFEIQVAVKCMLPPESPDEREQSVERFLREARAAARLNHPHLVRIFDVDEHRGLLYQVLEYAERGSVWDLVRSKGRLPVPEALRIVLAAAQGVACAHRAGIVHRDLKPGNLLLDGDGTVKSPTLGSRGSRVCPVTA